MLRVLKLRAILIVILYKLKSSSFWLNFIFQKLQLAHFIRNATSDATTTRGCAA